MARNPYALTFSRRMALAWRIATSRMAIDATLRDFLGEDSQGKSTSRAGWASTYDATKDRPWFQRHENLTDDLAAWRTNPLARRIVNLTRDHVWGNGIRPTSRINAVQKWLDRFWNHELNNMGERWPVWIDALTTDGEVFPTFHQNEVDGMVFVRALAAVQVEGLKWRGGGGGEGGGGGGGGGGGAGQSGLGGGPGAADGGAGAELRRAVRGEQAAGCDARGWRSGDGATLAGVLQRLARRPGGTESGAPQGLLQIGR